MQTQLASLGGGHRVVAGRHPRLGPVRRADRRRPGAVCRTENVSACHPGVAALVDGPLCELATARSASLRSRSRTRSTTSTRAEQDSGPIRIARVPRGRRGVCRSSSRSTSARPSPAASGWRRASTSSCRPTSAASFEPTSSILCAGRRPSWLPATPCCSTDSCRTTARPTEAIGAGGCSSPVTHRPASTTRAI